MAQPLGYLVGMALATILGALWGWRNIFFLTGGLGVIVALVVFLFVKDQPRGASEPELAEVKDLDEKFKFNWKTVGGLFRKKSLIILYIQGFIGVFPWQVITYYIFDYLAKSRLLSETEQLVAMVPAVLFMAAGYPVGGILGDKLFKKTPMGRAIIGAAGVAAGAVFLYAAMMVPTEGKVAFGILLSASAFFMPFASPNVLSSFYDVTEPEIRATTNAVQNFIETAGSAAAPLLAGILADAISLERSILYICIGSWAICFAFFVFVGRLIPKDIEDLKRKLRDRASGTATA